MPCDGPVEQGVGCQKYAGSDEHTRAAQHEDYMRSGGLGFGVQYEDSYDAMMSMHLQGDHGLSYKESDSILRPQS